MPPSPVIAQRAQVSGGAFAVSANAGADNPVRRDRNYFGGVPSIGGTPCPRSLWRTRTRTTLRRTSCST